MKLSIITPTYNRGALLKNLYNSIKQNQINSKIDVEWLIIDDGSEDNTKEVVENFEPIKNAQIKYYYQKNQGKMKAINNVVEFASRRINNRM